MKKRCYYEVLELSLKSTLSQIRHSYHKLAMKWHPDKNKSEEAKHKFQEINEAYSVLGNPSEKTWYDRHRETIIKNWNASTSTQTSGDGTQLTNGESYWPYFLRPAFLGYDDTDSGFYTVYRNVFKAIKDGVEEMNVLVNDLDQSEQVEGDTNMMIVRAPSFGDSETRLGEVAQFYYYWEHLIPFIESTWSHLHYLDSMRNAGTSDEERKWREKLITKFIEMIKNLVQFVKTKDPRYMLYLQNKAIIDEEEKERENKEKDLKLENVPNKNSCTQEIELFNDPEFEREVCLECWNWANMHLTSLMHLDPRDIDWASILFGALKTIANSKKPYEDAKFPALEAPDNTTQDQNQNQNQNFFRDKMEEEGQNNISYPDEQD